MIKYYIASPVQGVSMLTRAVTVLSPSTLRSADWTAFCAERKNHCMRISSLRQPYLESRGCMNVTTTIRFTIRLLFDIRTPWKGGCRTRSTGDRKTSTFLKSWFKLKAHRAAAQKRRSAWKKKRPETTCCCRCSTTHQEQLKKRHWHVDKQP